MDLRNFAFGRLIFLTAWTTIGGPASGLVMGLFFIVYQDGHRKGVLPPQGERPLPKFIESCRERLMAARNAVLPAHSTIITSRLSGDHR